MSNRVVEPISSSLLRRLFKWLILCILLFSSLQAWLNYRTVERSFNMMINDVAATHLPMLSVAIWDIEPQAIQKQINLLLENSHIAYVVIQTSTGQQFVGGDVEKIFNAERIVRSIPAPAEQNGHVGVLELVIDKSVLRQEMIRSGLMVLIEVSVLGIFILMTVSTILRRDLETPMRQLAEFVQNLQANQLSGQPEPDLEPRHRLSEIGLVLDGFRSMQNSIQKHIHHQDELVHERTRQLEKAMGALKELSVTDGLTSCYNRLLFNERMPGELQRATRYERALSVLFCDIDFFKSVNDQYGHSVGDAVLVAFAQTLKREIRTDVDWLVRYGGEEFLVILPETDLHAALEVAERMRVAVQNELSVLLLDGKLLRITASFGVAQKQDKDSVESLVQRADQWLYFSKTNGRNQVQPRLDEH
ncbi:GGDEF domain-containing protein [Undibacterium rugosum]|uniref:diguanylate cyclase n=2 Tax=Undibacterium TaxID=401469 RepID=A0A923I487_9BURK|nr:GGDEF domain-containing protein [Undibacterium rugosum]MBC3935769.1 GGDEF domain-containing protein [Undibacterium rugosum]MBR7778469.1 GGDEF domain-containing protein [Undibacterium rugosum]